MRTKTLLMLLTVLILGAKTVSMADKQEVAPALENLNMPMPTKKSKAVKKLFPFPNLPTPVELRMNDASQWKPDPGCKVELSKTLLGQRWDTIQLIIPVNKTIGGSSGMTIDNLNIDDAVGFSFDIYSHYTDALVNAATMFSIYIADTDGTVAEYYQWLGAGKWKTCRIALTRPVCIWKDGANGKLDNIDSINISIPHQAGETRRDNFYSLSFADFRVVKSAFVEKQRRLAMRCRYDKLLAVTNKYNKESQMWIMNFNIISGEEDRLVAACRGAYEEGIGNIFAWSYRGSKWMSKLTCDNPDLVWDMLGAEYRKMHIDR